MFVQSPLSLRVIMCTELSGARAPYHTAVTAQLAALSALELLQLRQAKAEETGKEIKNPSLKC